MVELLRDKRVMDKRRREKFLMGGGVRNVRKCFASLGACVCVKRFYRYTFIYPPDDEPIHINIIDLYGILLWKLFFSSFFFPSPLSLYDSSRYGTPKGVFRKSGTWIVCGEKKWGRQYIRFFVFIVETCDAPPTEGYIVTVLHLFIFIFLTPTGRKTKVNPCVLSFIF